MREGFEVRKVFEHLDRLAYEIGPRRTGSKGGERAVEYLSSRLREWGLRVVRQEFKFVSQEERLGALLLLGLTSLLLSFLLSPFFSLLLWSPVLLLALRPELLPGRRACNLLAEVGGKGERRVLLAHWDSAPCSSLPRLHDFLILSRPLTLLLPTLLLLLRFPFPSLWPLGGILALLLFSLPLSLSLLSLSGASPGANDNASGVALLLEVARVCSQLNPRPPLLVVFTGAEEEGLWGSKALASGGFLREGDRILNVDTVGVGRPYVVTGGGLVRRRRTPSWLNREVKECLEKEGLRPGEWWTVFSFHDHLPLLHRGFPATTLTADVRPRRGLLLRLGPREAGRRGWRYLHTEEDLPERLDLSTLERVGRALLRFVGAGEPEG